MRNRIYAIITKGTEEDRISKIYDYVFCLISILSLIPLMFRTMTPLIMRIDTITMYVLVLDYLLRWMTADIAVQKPGDWKRFVLFPFYPTSLITALGILPSLGIVRRSWEVLRLMRIATLMHYSSQLDLLVRVLHKQRKNLLMVLGITLSYIFMVSLLIFNYDASTFPNFLDAVLWVSGTLTGIDQNIVTIQGYGVHIISMISSLFGIGIIALPTGIITSGFMEAIQERAEEKSAVPKDMAKSMISARPLNRKLVVHYVVVMILCILLNTTAYELAKLLKLPVWLDTLGTILAAILLEPAAALLVGFANNLFLSFTLGSYNILYYSISAVTALVTGFLLVKNRKILYRRFIPVMLLLNGLAGFLSFVVYEITIRGRLLQSDSGMNMWEKRIGRFLETMGINHTESVLGGLLVVKCIDMAVTFLLLFLICKGVDRLRETRSLNREE